jgi:hypothetical protein
MSDIEIKRKIRTYIRNSGFEANSKMICPIVRIMNMKYSEIDNKKVVSFTNEIISERL